MKRLVPILLLLSACGTPGRNVEPQPGDFAFIEVKLKG
jgi:hypothetical protein